MPTFLHEAAGSWLIRQYGNWRVAGHIDDVANEAMIMPPSPREYKMVSYLNCNTNKVT